MDATLLFDILADESRRKLILLLFNGGEQCVCHLYTALNIPQPKASRHLAVMREAGLVTARREGKWMHYRLNPQMPLWCYRVLEAMRDGYPEVEAPGAACETPHTLEPAMKTVLILCTGNSCRSQMGEALINHDLTGRVRALSAGTRPQPKVADGAIEALRLAGVSTEDLYPKDVDQLLDQEIDLVVSVCDNAKESCPIFPRPVRSIHLPFHDPHGEPLESFIRVRDDIRARLIPAVVGALEL